MCRRFCFIGVDAEDRSAGKAGAEDKEET